jgi:glycosyltransferase involved in cell wall biosynthesis
MPEFPENSVLVIVPAYNIAATLPELLPRLRNYVCDTNLLFVDDGSTDDTRRILETEGVSFLSFKHNQGKGAALRAGFNYAIAHGYRSVLTIDADLQHLPEEIPGFYAHDDGRSLVLGVRAMSGPEMPAQRQLSNFLTSLFVSVFSARRVRDSQSGFRLIPTSLLRRIKLQAYDYDIEADLLFKAGTLGWPMIELPITTIYHGEATYIRPIPDTLRFIRLMWRRIWM